MDNCLTRKQQAFVLEYIKDRNGTQAAKRAGYSERRASEISWQLLQKTTVLKAIQDLQDEIEQQLRMRFVEDAIKAREVLRGILDNPDSTDRDKITAARDLLDRAGFKPVEKKELSGSGSGNPIEIKFVDPS
ncbi:terminase small subunit [Neobacillus niacini]|uniref:terminase small subunit n=1 Tax=Neobacillus niacini TaxID=86668 RepID=UPI001C8CF42B|nr:terminase small subunit [Neobacillus niacini]MBY0144310.1 terminase small subunit [Neobacillus niacini]